ncbi:MAG: chemotaxis-specific protein-glutamate methyltransferase CheB [Beijerinckiaceae bacterium]
MAALHQTAIDAPRVRVVIVDDSVAVRGFIARWLNEFEDIEIVGSAADGREAVSLIAVVKPDVVILDIEMPQLNGIEALPLIRLGAPNSAVIVSSNLTRSNAELAMRCLESGAAEILPKPTAENNVVPLEDFKRELVDKVRALGGRQVPRRPRRDRASAYPVVSAASLPASGSPRVVLVGASTGGPTACIEFLTGLRPLVSTAPVVIAQHMPPIFTRVFADHLAVATDIPCCEATHGEALRAGRVYVAPGGRHLTLAGSPDRAKLVVDDRPPVRFSRPSIDLLFESGRDVFGADAAAVVLTGMGADGLEGARALVSAGARVYAQSEETSVVWGMPRAIARAGLASEIGAPAELAASLVACGRRS